MLVMIVELMWWGRKSRTLLLLLLVQHGKRKLIKIRKFFILIQFIFLTSFLAVMDFSGYPCPPYKIIILDEADSMTEDAQVYCHTTFFYICNKCFRPNTYAKLVRFYILL
jgi:hypothetical protein